MKVRCSDGLTRRFVLPYWYFETQSEGANCVECGESLPVCDTEQFKEYARSHISCRPDPKNEEPHSINYWIKKFGFRWNNGKKSILSNDTDWYKRDAPVWTRTDVLEKIEKLYFQGALYREDTNCMSIYEYFKRLKQMD